ncbi:hypothetical protein V6N13_044479 [Hibiscus sabdariffa]
MATVPSIIQTGYHTRSNSFPSRSHPLTSEVDEHLSRLASSESASTSSLLNHKLGRVQDLHDCIEKMLQLPFTQQMLSQEQQRECVDELLNGSLRLLDVCAMAKDALLQVKECTLELQSVLRRKRGATKGFSNEVRKYLTSKKAAKKAILRALKNLKHKENKQSTVANETGSLISLLKEVQAVTLKVVQSLLAFTFGPEKESQMIRWSMITKLLHPKRVSSEGEEQMNEMEIADASLQSLATSKSDMMQIEKVQNELKLSQSCIQDFEEGLEAHMEASMITSKKLIRMTSKWQKIAAIGSKRIVAARTNKNRAAADHSNKPSVVDKGCFVIYTMDKRRFVIPLAFLGSCIFSELFKMSEEEFGRPSDGPITLPCDSVLMNYIVSLVKRGLDKDMERAVLNSITTYRRTSSDTYLNQVHADQQSLVCGL